MDQLTNVQHEDHDLHVDRIVFYSSTNEEEKRRHESQWQQEQESERHHERLKQLTVEYESKCAEDLEFWCREQLDGGSSGSARGARPSFKDQALQINIADQHRIKVNIYRNIPIEISEPTSELQKSILDLEDVVLKRRKGEGSKPIFDREIKKAANINKTDETSTVVAVCEEQSGEGSKPIFDREEIKKADNINEVEERRTVVAISGEQSGSTSKPQRYCTDSKHQDNRTEFRDHHKNNERSSIEKHREYKEKYIERDPHKYKTDRSRSRERDSRKSHSRSLMEERSSRDRYRDRSNERSRERRDRDRDKERDRDRSRERRDVAPHYIGPPIHVPIYYNLPPRPIVVSPMVPFPRGQVPPMGRGRHSLMAPVRPFPPRFIPPDIYRLGPPPPNSKS